MPKIDERIYEQALNLNTAIDYQNESIVSQTLIGKETGTVSLFAVAQEDGLSEHTAPFDALVQVIEGQVEIQISKTPHILNAGEIIVMPANKPHALKAITAFKMLWTMIKSWDKPVTLSSHVCLRNLKIEVIQIIDFTFFLKNQKKECFVRLF